MSYAQLAASVDALYTSTEQLKTATNTALDTLVSAKDVAVTAKDQAEAAAMAAGGRFDSEVAVDSTPSKVPRAQPDGKLADSWLSEAIARWATFSGPTGASLVGGKTDVAGSFLRTLQNFMNDHRNIRDFGGTTVGNGLVDDSAAIQAMGTALGYVIIPSGNFRIMSNQTFAFPQFYQPGASLTIDPAVELKVTNRIHSDNQWIFKGTGKVTIFISNGSGEDAQTIQGGWFGVFPTNGIVTDVTANMQRALTSLSSQTREGILQVECGSFHVSGTMFVPRGVHLAGRGTRRTIWDVSGAADFTIFETLGTACKFTDFQYEYPSGQDKVRTAPYIHVKHGSCDIKNIHLFPSTVGILVDATQCNMKGIRATYGLDPQTAGTDTSLIWCRAGSYTIDDVEILNTTYFPHSLIRVGHTSTISVGRITNVQSSSSCPAVFYDARACAITRVSSNQTLVSPSAGAQFSAVVRIEAAAAFTVNHITIAGVVSNSYADAAVHIEQSGTAIISNIAIGNSTIQGGGGAGLRLVNNSSNTIRQIHCANDCDFSARATPVVISGTGTVVNLDVPPHMKGPQHAGPVLFNGSIGDDAIVLVTDNRASIFAGCLIITSSNAAIGGIFNFRAAASSNHMTVLTATAAMATATTDLTGTTGVDGKFTIGINSSGKLVLENRFGLGLTICVTMLAGN